MIRGVLFCIILFLVSCSKNRYNPEANFNDEQRSHLVSLIVRYATKPPKGVDGAHRFDSKFDKYYAEQASRLRLDQLSEQNGTYFFLVSKPAPSVADKRHATGGKLRMDERGNIVEYEEVFRTWKMHPDTLKRRSYFLFDKMARNEPLFNYYPNVTGDQYIEFPDARTYYDVSAAEWSVR